MNLSLYDDFYCITAVNQKDIRCNTYLYHFHSVSLASIVPEEIVRENGMKIRVVVQELEGIC